MVFDIDMRDDLPPTEEALRLRQPFIASQVVLMLIVVGKFVISDFWGAISLILVVVMGSLVLASETGISATNAAFYTLLATIQGVFDTLGCMLYFQHSKYKFWDSKAPGIVLFAQFIFIISPIALFVSGYISHCIFASMRDHYLVNGSPYDAGYDYYGPQGGYGGGQGGYGRGPAYGGPPGQPGYSGLGGQRGYGGANQGPGGANRPGNNVHGVHDAPRPFSGQGNRLG